VSTSPSRGDSRVAPAVEAIAGWANRHWLLCFNTLLSFYVLTTALAPILSATGHQLLARPIYFYFHFLCHQDPDRSFHIAGHQMAVCERCLAIYGALLVGGLVFALLRSRLAPLSPRGLLLFALPMAVDGLTQLAGLRESTWELRLATGALFGFGVCWLVLPHLERGLAVREGQVVEHRGVRDA
jgi:uncharacterized membrane protein